MTRQSTTARGYGTKHQKARAKWARLLKREGSLPCARCGGPVYPTWTPTPPTPHTPRCPGRRGCEGRCWSTWDLDHDDQDRTQYLGVAHSSCNRSAGAVNSNLKYSRQRPSVSAPPTQAVDYGW